MELQQLEFLKHFFRFKRSVYFDHNATTIISGRVRRKMNYVLKNCYGNPSSLYRIARKSAEIIEQARMDVADAIHADTNEVYFTGCATESNNAVLKSVSNFFYPRKKKIISTPIEHPSVMNTLEFLKKQGIIVEYCSVDRNGHISVDELERLIDNDTFLLCCMFANNEIGTIQNIPTITKIAKQHSLLVLSDCVQAFGKIPIDLHGWGVDYASFSAHKLYGPKGIGALYVKKWSPFTPFMHGGHQEDGMRAGTESIHNIAGFGEACKDIEKIIKKNEKTAVLKGKLIDLLKRIKPDCIINTSETACLPNTISVTFPNVNNAGLMAMLDYHGIAVSAGSACSSSEDKPSYTLKAIGLSDQATRETIRISLGCSSTLRDVKYAILVLQKYFNGKTLLVNMMTPEQLNEKILFDEKSYILDVRPQFLRTKIKSLPNSHEASFISMEKYLHILPKNKHIIVVCQKGYFSYITAYYLKSKGFELVSSLQNGIVGWKARHSELYEKYAGQNITVLKPARR